jgi:glycosyl-4,4'-diaponeurosporenoate acyltransferase
VIPLSAKVWGVRILIVATIVLLCVVAKSGIPSWAVAISWSPNGLFLAAFTRGTLRFPRAFEPIHPIEPALYRWLGVGLVKRIVANQVWPMVHGFKPPEKPKNRDDFLDRIELNMKAAEICHAATFVLASCIAMYYEATGRTSVAIWITAFNVAFNAYPVMLQRLNRWRMKQGRVSTTRELTRAA